MRTLMFVGLVAAAIYAPIASAAETEVEINGGKAPLKGSLLLPDGSARVPAVLILAGSGPTDRNGNSPAGINTDAYKLVAQEFAKQGIASLRVDKRGVAASAGAAAKEEDLRFETYVEDAGAWIAFLKRSVRTSQDSSRFRARASQLPKSFDANSARS